MIYSYNIDFTAHYLQRRLEWRHSRSKYERHILMHCLLLWIVASRRRIDDTEDRSPEEDITRALDTSGNLFFLGFFTTQGPSGVRRIFEGAQRDTVKIKTKINFNFNPKYREGRNFKFWKANDLCEKKPETPRVCFIKDFSTKILLLSTYILKKYQEIITFLLNR